MTYKKINEGFWDSLVTKVKRSALAAGDALGNRSSRGKLSAQNLADQLYNAYKVYAGETGALQTGDEVEHFLKNEVEFGDKFSQDWGDHFHDFISNPKGWIAGGRYDQNVQQTELKQEPAASTPAKEPEVTQSAKPETVSQQRDELTQMGLVKSSDGSWTGKVDGSDVALTKDGNGYRIELKTGDSTRKMGQVPIAQVTSQLKQLISAESEPTRSPKSAPKPPSPADQSFDSELDRKLTAMKMTATTDGWSGTVNGTPIMVKRNKVGGYDVGNYQSGKMVNGKTNASAAEVMAYLAPKKESVAVPGGTLFEATVSDGQLRKFFLVVAQNALKTGEAKTAAKNEISRIGLSRRDARAAQSQDKNTEAPKQSSTTSNSPTNNTKSNTQQATANTAPQTPAAPTKVELAGVNLSDQEQEVLSAIESTLGTEGLVDQITTKGNNPEVQTLARKIFKQALRDYREKVPKTK